jgi:hypothetical protein
VAIASQFRIDPYYAPDIVRFTENGAIGLIAVLSIVLLGSALLSLFHARAGRVLVGLMLPVLLLIALFSGSH